MKPTIELWEHQGIGLIVELPTGVVYSNQTGGFSCLQPSLEGAFLPLGAEPSLAENLSAEDKLLAYFEGPKHGGAGATQGLDAEDADFIDGVLAEFHLGELVRVDRTRLAESHEAWVRVLLLGEGSLEPGFFHGLGPYPRDAVLTWLNSD